MEKKITLSKKGKWRLLYLLMKFANNKFNVAKEKGDRLSPEEVTELEDNLTTALDCIWELMPNRVKKHAISKGLIEIKEIKKDDTI